MTTDGSRYRATYFDMYPGVWRLGDWVRFTERGSLVITGRSDATLNRGGVRLGTAEFYRVVEELAEIDRQPGRAPRGPGRRAGRTHPVRRDLATASCPTTLRDRIVTALRNNLSPRHVPDSIRAVPPVPRNRTGKKLELPVKRILLGADPDEVASRDSLARPDDPGPVRARPHRIDGVE